TNDGPFETIRRTEYLTDHANPTGYSQTIMETETSANGTPIKRTVYTIGHDQISQTVYQAADTSGNGTIGPEDGWGAGVTHYFGMDGNGSVRVLYDALAAVVTSAANVLQVFHYDAYGNLLNIAATSALTSYLYSGEAFDTRINQQYLRARWYDPAAGRFTSLDPFRGNTSDPQSLHKYLYVHDDPVNGIDPSGLFLIGTMQISSIRNHLANLQADAGLKLIEGVYRLGKGASIAGIGLEFVIGDLFGIGIPFFGAAFKRLFNVIGRQSARVLSKMLPKVAGEYLLPGIFHVSANEISRLFSKQLASELNKGVDGAILRKEIARLNGLTQASLQGVGIQFHHVIPKELKNHPLFLTVHMNFDAALNALPLNQIVHYTDHPNYTSGIRKILDEIHASSLSNGQKREKLLQTITNANCSILGGRRGRPVTPDELSPTEWQRLINPFNEG
ncbi:MAG: RHS repeat-associated core domain-containing protein, partial [Pirellulaceae bacterium]